MYCDLLPSYIEKFPINFADAGGVESATNAFNVISLRAEHAINAISNVRSDSY
jgi:hypothetical protein